MIDADGIPSNFLGHQFKCDVDLLPAKLTQLRKKIKLANALREYEGTDVHVGYGDWRAKKRFKVEVYYRLGEGNQYAKLYSKTERHRRRQYGAYRIDREHAQYASVYVREALEWKRA